MSAGRRFRIIKEIAEGGFGKVYLAEQISSDGFSRIVAVKLLHAKWSSHDEVVMRTRDEARLLGLIRHQHIVKVEDLTAIDGKCAIVMEYLEGVDLKWMIQFLTERGLEFPRAALFEIILASAGALDAAYNGQPLQGGDPLRVIHRDIKPSNLFVTVAGGAKVLDFGTARANFAEREAKTQALAFGSQGYMAPERMLGEEDTPAADIFSLGITLYELLTLESFGRIPPRPAKFMAKVDERVKSVPLNGSPDWADQVRETLRLMLSYEPTERPTGAQLVEIMEILAQDAGDMPLRRFCRTLVSEAKANLPDLDTGDPLCGTVVDEDVSAGFAKAPMGVSQAPGPAGVSSGQYQGAPAPLGSGPAGIGGGPQSMNAMSSGSLPNAQAAGASNPGMSAPYPNPSQGGGSSGKSLIIGGLLLVILLGSGLLLLVLLAGGAAFFTSGGGSSTSTPARAPAPITAPATAPAPVAAAAGGRVVSPDGRSGVSSADVTLAYSESAGGEIVISGGEGFKAEWDGKAPFELPKLGEGRYSTMVTDAGGRKTRGKSFSVDGGKKTCSFTFDVAKKDWVGSCK